MKTFVAIEIGGTKLQIVMGDGAGTITQRFRFGVSRDEGAAGIRAHIERTLNEIRSTCDLAAVGVGFGGPVDHKTGKVACSHQISGWSEFPLGQWIQSLAGVPVHVDNDANVAALGEATHGAGRGANPVFYVTMGSGVGGGLVINGNIYHGMAPGESEIGHIRLDKTGRLVEDSCSGWAVDRKIRAIAERNSESILAQLINNETGGEARFLGTAIEQGDPAAEALLDETADDLAFGLSHIVHLFHPAIIVLGGGLSLVGEPLRAAVDRQMPKYLMEVFHATTRVTLASLREDAVPIGALVLASQGSAA